jgi:fructokinase
VTVAGTPRLGGVEAGGTKWICAVGGGPDDLGEPLVVPTTSPEETIGRVIEFFAAQEGLDAIGIGTFGPVDVDPASATWGSITSTPKPGWAHVDVAQTVARELGLPVGFDTDVNAAALGELRWGAAIGLDSFCYVTVGTGIGGGAFVNGQLVHGLLHPELGHMRVPHDLARDAFPGACPFHGDCLEGLASGEALRARTGTPASDLGDDDPVWELEAHYLAQGLVNVICTLSPQRLVVGGGVLRRARLLGAIRAEMRALLGGYLAAPELDGGIAEYVVAPGLGERAGVLGALELARAALVRTHAAPSA